jgi:hypothetical protein
LMVLGHGACFSSNTLASISSVMCGGVLKKCSIWKRSQKSNIYAAQLVMLEAPGRGDLHQAGGPTSSSIHMITPITKCNPVHSPEFPNSEPDSTFHHQCLQKQTWKIKRMITGGSMYLHTHLHNQHIYGHFCQQHATHLDMPTRTAHLLWNSTVYYHVQESLQLNHIPYIFYVVHTMHCQ